MADIDKNEIRLDDICDVQVLAQAWDQIYRGRRREELYLDVIQDVDYEADLEGNLFRLIRRIRNQNYQPSARQEIPSAKKLGITRPTTILDIEDAIICQAIAWKIALLLDKKLDDGVFSMRATGKDKKPYKNWYDEWPKYQNLIRALLGGEDKCLVISDISTYFDNIDLRILKEMLLNARVSIVIADLVTFMLDAWMYRPLYGVPAGRGVPQASSDLPHALANFYLHIHDGRMVKKYECGGKYLRWMDDMNVIVGSEIEGKRILGNMNDSLRGLFLTLNLQKTQILSDMSAIERHFWFEENDFLTDMEKKIKKVIKGELERQSVLDELVKRYEIFIAAEQTGNWDKVLKRYYTMFKRINSNYLVPHIYEHLCQFSQLEDKICDYIRDIDYSAEAIHEVINYLNSIENIYPSIETRLLNLLLDVRVPESESEMVQKISRTGIKYAYGKEPFSSRHWYSQCLGSLLVAKYGQISDIRRLAKFLVESGDQLESELKKHLLAISFLLPSGDQYLQAAIQFSKSQHDRNLSRLINFYEDMSNMGKGQIPERVKRRLILRNTDSPVHKYLGIRIFILIRILTNNLVFHSQLKSICKKLKRDNEDPVMGTKIGRLLDEIS